MTRETRFELLAAEPIRQALHVVALREEHPDMFEDMAALDRDARELESARLEIMDANLLLPSDAPAREQEPGPCAVYHYRAADTSETLVIARPDYRTQVRKYDPMLFPDHATAFDWCYSTAIAANSTGRRVGIRQEQEQAPDR